MSTTRLVTIHKPGHPMDGQTGNIESEENGYYRVRTLGSSFNAHFLPDEVEFLPLIGMGATKCYSSDSYPYTVIGLESDSHGQVKYVIVQEDMAIRVSGSFEYERNPDGRVFILRRDKGGKWCDKVRIHFDLGYRRYHQSPEG